MKRSRLANELCFNLDLNEIEGFDRWNSFTETLLRFEIPVEENTVVGFSRDTVAAFTAWSPGEFYYPIGQVFEPDVLREVCDLQRVILSDALALRSHNSVRIESLRASISKASTLDDAELIVLASALVTLSRFELALDVLSHPGNRSERFNFEAALLRYIIGNRTTGSAMTTDLMSSIRVFGTSSTIPARRLLDACTTAVVWYVKGVGVGEDDFEWFARTGDCLIVELGDSLPATTVSAWYRGVAMLPATLGDTSRTRELMEKAANAADIAVASEEGPFAQNLRKTYLESSVKEHIYVSKNRDAAWEAARTLVALDPCWSVSVGEYADALAAFGQSEQAARAYDEAVSLGAPYVTYHLKCAARQYEKAGNIGAAVARNLVLAALLPDSKPAIRTADMLLDSLPLDKRLHDARRQLTAH